MKSVKGVYIDTVEVRRPDGEVVGLDVWMNPETGKLFGLTNMEVDATKNYANDPYEDDTRVVFEDTFSGLPK
jgi:hypothetical protein